MKIKVNDTELEIISADNSIYFNEEVGSRRLSVTLVDNSFEIEDLIYLKQSPSSIVLINNENKSIEFVDYTLESIRKNYGLNSRITMDFIKK